MIEFKLTKEIVPCEAKDKKQAVLHLNASNGQYRQYSYLFSENDRPEDIAEMEAEAVKLMQETIDYG